MRIARVRYRGKTTSAVVTSDDPPFVHFVRGGSFGRLERTGERAPLAEVRLLAPVRPTKVVAIGINYRSHAGDRPVPEGPEPFLKAPSSVIGPGEAIVLPPGAGRVEEEAEVVAVIGRRARNLREDEVDRHVLGYTCGNDVSARAWQQGDLQWWRAKSSDTFTAVGPWVETALDPERIALRCRVNGEVVQEGHTRDLVHSIRRCIAHISSAMTLERGDLVFTGTPGVPVQIRPGDTVEVAVDGVGVLSNPVAATT